MANNARLIRQLLEQGRDLRFTLCDGRRCLGARPARGEPGRSVLRREVAEEVQLHAARRSKQVSSCVRVPLTSLIWRVINASSRRNYSPRNSCPGIRWLQRHTTSSWGLRGYRCAASQADSSHVVESRSRWSVFSWDSRRHRPPHREQAQASSGGLLTRAALCCLALR